MNDYCFALQSYPKCNYERLRDFLVLPCKRKLQYITSSIDKDQVMRETFDKVQTLQQKNVFLLVDEVQIRPTVSISGGLLSGMAENNRDCKATSILITSTGTYWCSQSNTGRKMQAPTYHVLWVVLLLTVSLVAISDSANSLRSMIDNPPSHNIIPLSNIVDNLPVGKPPGLEDDIPGPALTPDELAFQLPPLDYAGEDEVSDPLEDPGVFQGDIWFKDEDERRLMTKAYSSGSPRNAVLHQDRLWPFKEIPYVISSTFSKQQRHLISAAIKEIENNSCIKFVPREMQEDYIHLYKGDGCSSQVGRIQKDQAVSLADACIKFGVIIHELMHAVGFWHEQSRFDRDNYITINWHNIKSGMEHNFKKYEWNFISNLSMPYDLDSIMHYGHYSFSMDHKRGIKTIEPNDGKSKIGQRRGLSKVDIAKLNKLYNCNQAQQTKVTTPPPDAAAGNSALGEFIIIEFV
ncbi:Peptidase M12A [Trinorchestia longiramus]|nr:Peptidase M12A [Trinorchestia longiramus]